MMDSYRWLTGLKHHSDVSKPKKRNNKRVWPTNASYSYRAYVLRAEKKGIEFEFSVDQFNSFKEMPCSYCGATDKIGIDRINPKEGYTVKNSQPCCFRCNIMKYTFSHEDFLNQIRKIYENKFI